MNIIHADMRPMTFTEDVIFAFKCNKFQDTASSLCYQQNWSLIGRIRNCAPVYHLHTWCLTPISCLTTHISQDCSTCLALLHW